MSKNSDFFQQNERFKGLIKHYARKLGDREAESDLWSFLWILQNTTFSPLPDNYIAVCLRNKYYDLLKDRKKFSWVPIENDVPSEAFDVDRHIDVKNALNQLEMEERELIFRRFFGGESYAEQAEKDNVSRQAKSQKARRILKKMQGFF